MADARWNDTALCSTFLGEAGVNKNLQNELTTQEEFSNLQDLICYGAVGSEAQNRYHQSKGMDTIDLY